MDIFCGVILLGLFIFLFVNAGKQIENDAIRRIYWWTIGIGVSGTAFIEVMHLPGLNIFYLIVTVLILLAKAISVVRQKFAVLNFLYLIWILMAVITYGLVLFHIYLPAGAIIDIYVGAFWLLGIGLMISTLYAEYKKDSLK